MRTIYTSYNQWPIIGRTRFHSPRSTEELIGVTASPAHDRADRCGAVFALCARHWTIGARFEEALSHLGRNVVPEMLGIDRVTAIAGYVPLRWNLIDRLYCAYVFPQADGWSDHVIYFTVSPDHPGESFNLDEPPSGILSQFTLCSPDDYEWHTAAGIHAPAF